MPFKILFIIIHNHHHHMWLLKKWKCHKLWIHCGDMWMVIVKRIINIICLIMLQIFVVFSAINFNLMRFWIWIFGLEVGMGILCTVMLDIWTSSKWFRILMLWIMLATLDPTKRQSYDGNRTRILARFSNFRYSSYLA